MSTLIIKTIANINKIGHIDIAVSAVKTEIEKLGNV